MGPLNLEQLMDNLRTKDLSPEKVTDTQLKVMVNKENLLTHLSYLQAQGFEHLSFMSGVDYLSENEFEVVYHVFSYTHLIHCLVKVRIDRDRPVIPTITGLWEQAQFYEQEIHEFFGIVFEGNKDLSGLFLENWLDIPPLRKDFNTKEFSIRGLSANVNGGEE
jgi:NADH-quinone oxidoreductase subunit C